ncbi:hypothetical protein [Dyadobacter frigoris]|uniref:Uncharacterized protein n=1 Tax=Dyadobacter frigoris TaxID=2576211 RepID=A0A4U6D4K8_9BACT|nr:hypothetical protein [Dyadobacter frigoris]TKT88924.1 hypothetical protein FDK13_25165 [Dyadobacter frigoris]GLU56977.1 hypothetical protein Dfri01_64380 [Dyadobacter frigoris]
MEPVNKNQRKSAIGKFIGLYALSLTFPVLAVYLLLRVPGSIAESESNLYKEIVLEQSPLLVDTDTLSQISRKLIQQDGIYSSATDEMAKATARTQLVDIESRINSIMSHFNLLAASAKSEQNRRLSSGVAKLTEALVTYRQTISELRHTLDGKGIDMQVINDLRSQINMKDLEIKGMERQLMAGAAGGGGGGGGGADPSKELQTKLAAAQKDLDNCRSSKSGGGGSDASAIQKQLDECLSAKAGTGVTYREWLRYAEAEGYYQLLTQGNLRKNDRKVYYDQAKQIFDGLQLSTNNKEMKSKALERLIGIQKNQP